MVFAFSGNAFAGIDSWTYETRNNPFSGGVDVTVIYIVSVMTQVQIKCDSAGHGVEMIVIPGYEANTIDMVRTTAQTPQPTAKLAVDGDVIFTNIKTRMGAYGENLAGISMLFEGRNADKLTSSLITARSQVAIEDGISDRPLFLSARGSTVSARQLKFCHDAQNLPSEQILSDDDELNAERIAEIEAEIVRLQAELSSRRARQNLLLPVQTATQD